MANLNSDAVIFPGKSNETLLKEALAAKCPDAIPEAQAISLIILEDGKTLDMLGVYYNMGKKFESKERSQGIDRKLEPDEFVDLIKTRNPGYEKLTFGICTAMYGLSYSPLYEVRFRKSCRGRKWRAVRDAFDARGHHRDEQSPDENEALYIYNTMMREADELKAGKGEASSASGGDVKRLRLGEGVDL